MARLDIQILLDNAAFQDGEGNPAEGPEVARILRELARRIDDERVAEVWALLLRDSNGNRVGVTRRAVSATELTL